MAGWSVTNFTYRQADKIFCFGDRWWKTENFVEG